MSLLYKECARIITLVTSGRGSVKSLCLNTRNPAKTKVYAIVFNTLKHYSILQNIASAVSLETTPFVLVHLYELLYRGSLKTGGKLKSQLMKGLPELKKMKANYHTDVEFRRLPLYARINTLKVTDPVQAIQALKEYFPDVTFTGDPHVNFLLKFPPSTNFSQNPLYKTGQLLLQDKASCLPAVVLEPPEHGVVLDACSAPGNKTLHLAALMKNTGTIYAVEKDKKRFERMKGNISRYGGTNIVSLNNSFLDLVPADYKSVTHVLLDPSCSGSGMVTQRVTGQKPPDKTRLKHLADLQKSLISHAMLFPNVGRIVYSTCSVHSEENECVVKEILDTHPDWELVSALPAWERRGLDSVLQGGEKCVRCSAEDQTNGFFLACFVKRAADKDWAGGRLTFQRIFSVHHLNKRFKIKYHYKYPYKFLKL